MFNEILNSERCIKWNMFLLFIHVIHVLLFIFFLFLYYLWFSTITFIIFFVGLFGGEIQNRVLTVLEYLMHI